MNEWSADGFWWGRAMVNLRGRLHGVAGGRGKKLVLLGAMQ